MLFSEPKIPQCHVGSVLRIPRSVSVLFSEPKIPQFIVLQSLLFPCGRFSALQRAENSSIWLVMTWNIARLKFQCSSASRKFLNTQSSYRPTRAKRFQCSSASRKFLNRACDLASSASADVSVLFSEPKIPQYVLHCIYTDIMTLFQCSSASRKFLNATHEDGKPRGVRFQCSSASRKFLNAKNTQLARSA